MDQDQFEPYRYILTALIITGFIVIGAYVIIKTLPLSDQEIRRDGDIRTPEKITAVDTGRDCRSGRFNLTTPTGIAFLYPNDWPRVNYLENYEIQGVLFEDNNENGVWNANEMGVQNAPVHVYWGPGTTREILPIPVTGSTQQTLGLFSTSWDITETMEGPYRLNFTFRGLTTPNGTSYYEYDPGAGIPPGHWLAKEPSYLELEAEIWHEVKIDFQITSPNLENIEVGDTLEISGILEDYHLGWGLSQKVLYMKFDNNPVYPSIVDTTGTGTFSYQYTIPETIRPGTHTFSIEYHSGHTDPQTQEKVNYYYIDNSADIEFKVHRPTYFTVEDKEVFRTDTIDISGKILDNMDEGPARNIANESYEYEVIVEWGDPTDLYYEADLHTVPSPSGNFTRQFTIKKTQPLARVHLTFHFRVKNAEHGATMYYREAWGEVYYTVRARTFIELHVMEEGGKDELDEVGRTGPASTFRISGVLWDGDQRDATGHHTCPIQTMSVALYWDIEREGNGERREWSVKGSGDEPIARLTTDEFGRFSKEITLNKDDPIGPVVIQAVMEDAYWYEGFDTDSHDENGNYRGLVMDVTSIANIIIYECPEGIKGENISVNGKLHNDRGEAYGIPDRPIVFYWKPTPNSPLGDPIGNTTTDRSGNFEFSSYRITGSEDLDQAYIVAVFTGSPKYVHQADGKAHYLTGDAYAFSESGMKETNVTAYVEVKIDPSILDGRVFTKCNRMEISGEVVELCAGARTIPPRYAPVVNLTVRIGDNVTIDILTDDFGQFKIDAWVPMGLLPGEYKLSIYLDENDRYRTKPEYLDSRDILIVSDTHINVIEEPMDVTGDEVADIGYVWGDDQAGYSFKFRLFEKKCLESDTVPIENVPVTLTVTLWDDIGARFTNVTTRTTDKEGYVEFRFPFFISIEGIFIDSPGLGAAGQARLEFEGSDYYTGHHINVDLNYMAKGSGKALDPVDFSKAGLPSIWSRSIDERWRQIYGDIDPLGDQDDDHVLNYLDEDVDGDGYSNKEEYDGGSDPSLDNSIPEERESKTSYTLILVIGGSIAGILIVLVLVSLFLKRKKIPKEEGEKDNTEDELDSRLGREEYSPPGGHRY